MNTTHVFPNSFESVQARLAEGRIPRYGPLLILVARSVFILLAQGLMFLLFLLLRIPDASLVIRNWWPVYGTLVDIGCLGLMFRLTRYEGIGLLDLVGLVKSKLKTEIPVGLGLFIIIFPAAIFGGGFIARLIAYGTFNVEFPQYTFMRALPLLPLLYARFIWWTIWSATEEMTYNGYALPRLIAITKSRWLSVLTVSLFFALQHSFLMLAGWRFGFYMFFTFVPLSIVMVFAYSRIRRLPPFIIAHWLMDLSNVWFLYEVV